MKKTVLMAAVALTAACSAPQALNPADVEEATQQVTRVEPLSWWTGMKTDLQLMIQGPGIASYDVSIPGGGLVSGEHKEKAGAFPNREGSCFAYVWISCDCLRCCPGRSAPF